jgi:hypothetical protein
MPAKVMSPAIIRPTNSTIGGTGLRMHQDEMLRKFMSAQLLVLSFGAISARPAGAG